VIFATVGSTRIPFERFIRALETLPVDRLLVQHGPVEPPAGASRAFPFMQFPEVMESMEEAEAVVCHAGAGSILCAWRAGHVPVVVPRMKAFEETVDDHQVELAGALAAEGKVIAVEDLADLSRAVASAPPRSRPEDRDGLLPIQLAVREALLAPA
jgi:UDP-N-acetylglucosamine--N-acetylmuramyl-(pentapeptide) pyrophosphoryl-undecaprenol N-acetylglucosamine transferase